MCFLYMLLWGTHLDVTKGNFVDYIKSSNQVAKEKKSLLLRVQKMRPHDYHLTVELYSLGLIKHT